MSSSFQRAQSELAPDEILLIEELLGRWYREPHGRVVSVNLRDREHYLCTASVVAMVRTLIAGGDLDFTSLAARYQEECYRHQLQGGPIQLSPLPRQLGRAVDTVAFTHALTRQPYLADPACAADFVDRLVRGEPLDPRELSLVMSPYTAWVTWNEADPDADPFGFVVHGLALEVRAALGLDRKVSGPLLLLRYGCPAELTLHRSTIADAGLNLFFDPPPFSMTAHSFTRPWPPEVWAGGIPAEWCPSPRPEAVHEPLELRNLARPVTELR